MSNVVDRGVIFDDDFADTDPVTSDEASISDSFYMVGLFVAAVDVAVSTVIEAQDPDGFWWAIDTQLTDADTTDCIPIPNVGRLRVTLTPASGTGSAKSWVRAYGG